LSRRKLGDPKRPNLHGGPIGVPVSEELFFPLTQSYIQEKEVDGLIAGSPVTFQGQKIRAASPNEVLAAIDEIRVIRQAAKQANRPGIANFGLEASSTAYGQLAGAHEEFGFLKTDVHLVPLIAELKTDYPTLAKVAMVDSMQGILTGYSHPIIGGYVGGPPGAAVAMVAADIMSVAVHKSVLAGHFGHDHRFGGNTSIAGLWAETHGNFALTVGGNTLHGGGVSPIGGPVTKMLLYEITAGTIVSTLCGNDFLSGVRSTGGRKENHCTAMEVRFMGKLSRAVAEAGLSLTDANDLALEFAKRYQDDLKKPHYGKPFNECVNVKTLDPTEEWKNIYKEVQKELEEYNIYIKES
jgi:methylamine--corrinoid protein Co-methyltransferase